jgi:hypothetical protein
MQEADRQGKNDGRESPFSRGSLDSRKGMHILSAKRGNRGIILSQTDSPSKLHGTVPQSAMHHGEIPDT